MFKRFAPLMVILAGVCWGCMGLSVRNLNALSLETMEIVAVRGYLTVIILGFFLFVFRRKLLSVRVRDLWCFAGTGIVSVLFFNYCYFKTMTITSLSIAAILLYTSPVFVVIISGILFKESITISKIVALFLTFFGCVLVSGFIGGGEKLSVEGLILGLFSGLGYALYSIFSRYAIKRGYEPFTITFYTFFFVSLGSLFISDNAAIVNVVFPLGQGTFWCAFIALTGTVLPYLFYTIGLKYMENSKAAIIVAIEPVVATLISLLVYNEKMSLQSALGVIMVLGALVVIEIPIKRNNGEVNDEKISG